MAKFFFSIFIIIGVRNGFAQTPSMPSGFSSDIADTQSVSEFESEMEVSLSSGFYRRYSDVNGNSVTDYNFRFTYLHEIEKPYQVGGTIGFQSVASKTYLIAMGSMTLNSQDDYTQAWFATLGAGGKSVDELESNFSEVKQVVRLSGELLVGKRIPIRKHFNFKPYVGLVKSGKSSTELIVSLLNFSFNW